jgi:diguanylate cyclase (GGDEF)-like protein
MAAVAALAWLATLHLGSEIHAADRASVVADDYAEAVESAVSVSRADHENLVRRDAGSLSEARQAVADLAAELQALSARPGIDRAAIAAVAAEVTRFSALSEKVFQLSAAGRTQEAARVHDDEVDPIEARFSQRLRTLKAAADADERANLIHVQELATSLGGDLAVVLGGTFLLALLLVTTSRRQRRRANLLANSDALTGLPNRLALARRAERTLAVRPITRLAEQGPVLLLLDLDRFKEINDGLGHHYGDQLLIQVARRLLAAVKSTDLVVRLGGDEFAVLIDSGGVQVAQAVADRIRGAVRKPFSLDGVTVEVDVSTGIAVVDESFTGDANLSTLLQRADLAMYAAKEAGSGSAVYSTGEDERVSDRIRLIGELRRAVDHEELVLHYQPKVALDDNRLIGVEALVRWQHPTQGLLPPASFLPAVENTELMDRITALVLSQALRQVSTWSSQGLRIPVAVNIPTRALLNLDFPDVVQSMLTAFDVPADLLCLEVTETGVMTNPERSIAVLKAIRALGVHLSIDDYGTGYTTMAYLKDLPVDELKIDRAFITHMNNDEVSTALARAVVELGHNLGLSVVAEGVESELVGAALREAGCDVAQGYHYARPMPADALTEWAVTNEHDISTPV